MKNYEVNIQKSTSFWLYLVKNQFDLLWLYKVQLLKSDKVQYYTSEL